MDETMWRVTGNAAWLAQQIDKSFTILVAGPRIHLPQLMNNIDNSTEVDMKLSIHGANMLIHGIENYVKTVRMLRKTKLEEDDYCDMMLFTAIKETQKLLDCMKALGSVFVTYQIKRLEELLESIHEFRSKLKR